MNKDVIYIEAEDDITDILSKVKNAKNKIVALVPPKKAGVLHSAVNFKLITKTATKAEKTVVLVSADESLKRLAATAVEANGGGELLLERRLHIADLNGRGGGGERFRF